MSPKNKKLAAMLVGAKLLFEIIDWIVGKVGYLGVFTAPEDWLTAMDRAPVFIQYIWNFLVYVIIWFHETLGWLWVVITSGRGTIFVFGGLLLLLVVDVDRWRGRLWFRMRHLVADQVWISFESATEVAKQSAWGKLKAPYTVSSGGIAIAISRLGEVSSGLSDNQKKNLRFNVFIRKTLESFCENNPKSTRKKEGKLQIDEVTLKKFLDSAVDKEVQDEFGKVPTIKVS